MILLIKTIHIIAAIVWIAALFTLAKTMLVSNSDSSENNDSNSNLLKLGANAYKLYANPAMMIAFVAGIALIVMNMVFMKEGWLHFKLLFLILLLVQHMMMKGQLKKLLAGTNLSMKRLKVNILVLILFTSIIVFMAVFKGGLNWMMFGVMILVELVIGALLINRE